MRDTVKLGENQIISVFMQLPLWFVVGENNFYIWNSETLGLESYHYHEMDVLGKKKPSTESLRNPIHEIQIVLPYSQKYTVNLNVNHEQEFNHFYLSLLGQLAFYL